MLKVSPSVNYIYVNHKKAIDYPEFLLVVTKRIINSGIINMNGITPSIPLNENLTFRTRHNDRYMFLLARFCHPVEQQLIEN